MLSIPLMNHTSTERTRPIYLSWLQQARADRVFLCPDNPYGDSEKLSEIKHSLAENIAYYTDNGLEVGVWIGGLGHGGMLSHETHARVGNYTRIRGLGNGGEAADSFCPLDPDFVAMYKNYVRVLAEAGAKMIQIDDDLRIAMHGPVAIGCACPRHMAELNRRAKEAGLAKYDYTREELATELFTGKPTPIRQIWLQLQGDTLRNFAAALRQELDSVDPTIRLGHCACLSTWDTDGIDSIELARILAGKTRPFLRLIGAPYWTDNHGYGTTGLGSVIDTERMQFAWCAKKAPEIELMSEGDVYPRPRYNVPSSYVECFHQVLTANGTPDILKYMLDYTFDPAYETGYIRRHSYFRPLRDEIAEAFAVSSEGDTTEPAGIYVYEAMHKLADMDCTGFSEGALACRLISYAANFTGALSLPISFTKSKYTNVAMVVGENAKTVPAEVVEMPLCVDATAAQILMERGFDLGIDKIEPMEKPKNETFPSGCVTPTETTLPVDTAGNFYRLTPKASVTIGSTYDTGAPAVIRYIRPNGAPVVVYAFAMETISYNSVMVKSYCRQAQLLSLLPALPVTIQKEPGAYVIARQNENKLVVGIWNFGHDMLLPDEITIDGHYTKLTPIGDTVARLYPAKGTTTVQLSKMIPPYSFAGFTLT